MFKNRVRLPMQIIRPQFPEERTSFRKANGTTQTLSVVIRKEYEGETDFLPESWHEKLVIALGHDTVRWEGDRYLGNVAKSGEYSIEWPDFLDYPTSKAKFKVDITPFDATNSNCMSCEEASQLSLEDDTQDMEEEQTYEFSVITNDTICCYPATFSLHWYNPDYITAASISESGVVTITTGADLISANGLKIATYRVTCPNGSYDEADIYANITGSVEGCLAPTNLEIASSTPTTISYTWEEAEVGAVYEYELYEGTGPVGSPVDSGQTPSPFIAITGLDSSTEYYFRVRTVCESANSNWVALAGDTPVQGDTCGEYAVTYDNGTGNPSDYATVRYRNCLGDADTQIVFNTQTVTICAFQTTPGVPLQLIGPNISYEYNGLC
jgi:ferredoxin-like protein FixX